MGAYKAFVLRENAGHVSGAIEMANRRDLPANDVTIRVKYSSLNHIDALILSGDKTFWKHHGIAPGVDVAGVVTESNVPEYKKGDEVIVTGGGLGIDIPGGFGQYVSVPAAWVIARPVGLSLFDAVSIGSDGLSAAIAAMEIVSNDAKGMNAVVSGAISGTGAFAVWILNKCGYHVTALAQDDESAEFIKALGAYDIVTENKFIDTSNTPLLAEKYSVAVDTEGGEVLSTMIRSLKKGGSVAVCGMAKKRELTTAVHPFILRGVNVVGIDAINCSNKLKYEAWYKLADDWFIKMLPMLSTEISLAEVSEYADRFLKNELKGRIIINHEL